MNGTNTAYALMNMLIKRPYRNALRRAGLAALGWLAMGVSVPVEAAVLAPEVLREAAMRYESGKGIKQDNTRAFQLYCVAALEGDAAAARHLADIYVEGQGRETDSAIAAGWLRYAVENGATSALALDSRLAGVEPVIDPDCPTVRGTPDRAKIETWVELFAREYGVDPSLVLAVISVESNFNPRALSPKGASGLMQLLPVTAKRFGVQDIWDPVQNIRGGISYLRWLIEQYSGRLRLVLSAYNAGEQAVEHYKRIPPYDETKHYVMRILIRYGTRHLIHPVDPLPIAELGPGFTKDATGRSLLVTSD
jgi:soluble lytic murein transglycosylase-like protein